MSNNSITIADVDATIRTISAVTGTAVDSVARTAESDIRFWLGVKRGLSIVSGSSTVPVATEKSLADLSRETQLAYWDEVRHIMKTRRVPMDRARTIYREDKEKAKPRQTRAA